jgi:hypothetical protein
MREPDLGRREQIEIKNPVRREKRLPVPCVNPQL